MIQSLLDSLMKLVDERGSAAALREHLALVATQVKQLEAHNAVLQANLEIANLQRQQLADELRRFQHDNPRGLRCDTCGSVDLVQTGSQDDTDFGHLVKHPRMLCRVCQKTSIHAG